jgi:hypothetical protein
VKHIQIIPVLAVTILASHITLQQLHQAGDGHATLGGALMMALLRNSPIGTNANTYIDYLKADADVAYFDRQDSIFRPVYVDDSTRQIKWFSLRIDLGTIWPTLYIYSMSDTCFYLNLFEKVTSPTHVFACLQTAESLYGHPTFEHFDTVTAFGGGPGATNVDDYRWRKGSYIVTLAFLKTDSLLVLTEIDTVLAETAYPNLGNTVAPSNWLRRREYRSH